MTTLVRGAVFFAALLLFLAGPAFLAPLAADEEATAPTTEEEEEPELTGEAKRKHDKEVKRLVKYLDAEKNRTVAKGKIEELGAQASRAARDALIKFSTGNKNQEYVHHSFMALAKIGGKTAIEYLCSKNALRSRDFLVAHSGAEALAEAKDDRAIGPLLDVMTAKRTKIKVVGACALALGKTAAHDDHAVEILFEQSRHRKDTIRAYTVESLGYLATDEAVARLNEALESDKNTRVREYAAMGLGHTKRTDVLPLLREALGRDTAHTVRTACMESIRKLQEGA